MLLTLNSDFKFVHEINCTSASCQTDDLKLMSNKEIKNRYPVSSSDERGRRVISDIKMST